MSHLDMSEALRLNLARVGIIIDEPIKPMVAKTVKRSPVRPNPDDVRGILLERGARERDIEWLVASCPSIDAARVFQPIREL